MSELNRAARDEATWEIVGDRVVPKSLNVAQLAKATFSKTLAFKRIRIKKIPRSHEEA